MLCSTGVPTHSRTSVPSKTAVIELLDAGVINARQAAEMLEIEYEGTDDNPGVTASGNDRPDDTPPEE